MSKSVHKYASDQLISFSDPDVNNKYQYVHVSTVKYMNGSRIEIYDFLSQFFKANIRKLIYYWLLHEINV